MIPITYQLVTNATHAIDIIIAQLAIHALQTIYQRVTTVIHVIGIILIALAIHPLVIAFKVKTIG